MLFQAFPASSDKTSPVTAKAYLIAIEGCTLPGLTEAVRKLIRGEFDHHAGRFIPSTAELAKAIRYEDSLITMRAEMAKRPAIAHQPQPDVVLSAEERQRRAKVLLNLAERIGSEAERV